MRAAVPAVPAIGAPRPLRRDAAENRSRLLAAASQVFDEQGLDAGVEEIARVAGVGMGTLYRRFPTKDALIDALVTDLLDAMIELAREAALRPDGLGLEYFLEGASDYQARNPGCLPRLWRGPDNGLVKIARGLISDLLEDAKRHGRVRDDLTSTDLNVILWSIRGVIETTISVAPQAWRRHLELVIGGMRPTDGTFTHAPLTRKQLDTILTPPRRA
jgi:AcrR family transcriptional regulator